MSSKAQELNVNIAAEDLDFEYKLSPFLLEKLSFVSDVFLSEKEFRHLVEMKEGDIVTAEDLKKACLYLKKKNKFESLKISIKPGLKGKELCFKLKGLWTFNRLRLYGLLIGKDFYRKYYLIEQGEIFSQEKHSYFVKKIREAIYNEGYINGEVIDKLDYDSGSKLVTVNLTLTLGRKFYIEGITFNFADKSKHDSKEINFLQRKVHSFFSEHLAKESYSKKKIIRETKHLTKYLSKKGFLNPRIELEELINRKRRSVKLFFNIKLGPRKQFVFLGNNFFPKKNLMETVLAFGRSVDLLSPSILSDEISRKYKDKGFSDVEIKTDTEQEKYFFIIKEGERKKIKFIEFKGANSFDHSLLLKLNFNNFLRSKYFDSRLLNDSINNMIRFYLKQGFWDIKVLSRDFVYLSDTNEYGLVIVLDEGERRYLKKVEIEGASELEINAPFLKEKRKMPFDPNLLQEQRSWLTDFFHKNGFLYVEIKSELKGEKDITLIWKLCLNQKVKFGKTIVLGSDGFNFDYIERELQYKKGEIWDKKRLKYSLMKLREIGVFDTTHLYPENISQKEEFKDILLKIRLDDPYEFKFRIGFQQVSKNFTFRDGATYKFGGSFIYKNPFKFGDLFRSDIDFTRYYRNIVFQYGIPWMFNLPFRGLFKVYDNKYTQPIFIGSNVPFYDVLQQGFLIALSHRQIKWDVGFNIGLEWMKTSGLSELAADAVNFERTLIDKKIPYIFFEPNVLIDNLDDKLNPKFGTFTILSLKAMQPLHNNFYNFRFLKFLISQSLFLPISNFLIAGARLRFGNIFSGEFNSIMPSERFYLGGVNSIRSYDSDMCPPLGKYDNGDDIEYLPKGGKTMFNMTFEIKFPLFKNTAGVIFQDIGSLYVKNNIEDSFFCAGTGFGFRYYTSIGPLRFDMAWKWKKRETDKTSFAWFLTFGQFF